MQKETVKFQSSTILEGMTSIRALIKARESGMNDRPIERILFDGEKLRKIGKEVGYLRAVSKKHGFELVKTDAEELDKLTLGTMHGGLVAITGERTIPRLSESTDIREGGFYCMMEGIEDPYNFGYALRSLYATGCDGVILPERNWMSAAGVVARSSAGASELFPLYTAKAEDAVRIFKASGYTVVSADEKTEHILGKCELKLPIFLVVGGEKRGISAAVNQSVDLLVKIPYQREFRASLSAASATTIFAYEIARQNSKYEEM